MLATPAERAPGVTASFRAVTDDARLGGLVSFFEFGGRTYQLLGFTTAAQLGRYAPVFTAVLDSFAPIRDPALLEVRQPRLEVVRLPEDMTMSEFQERYPSVISLDTLALINGVTVDEKLEKGSLQKRVVVAQTGR